MQVDMCCFWFYSTKTVQDRSSFSFLHHLRLLFSTERKLDLAFKSAFTTESRIPDKFDLTITVNFN